MTAGVPPSGEQCELVCGEARAVVVAVGGGLRSYTVGGHDVVDGYGEAEMASGGRGQVLAPWPNRLAGGRYSWDGADHQLSLTEPLRGNAIHGLVRWLRWGLVERTPSSAVLAVALPPQPGYPFSLDLSVSYAVGPAGLSVTTTGRNTGRTSLPYALGQHPYVAAGGLVDTCLLELNAATYLPTDDRGLPTGRSPIAGTSYDFSRPRVIGNARLDVAFTGLARDSDGRAWVALTRPDGGRVRVWVDESFPYVQLFTGDTVQPESRRRRGLAVEPMTAPPNAFATGADVIRLEPGQTVTSSWGIAAD